MSFPKPSAVFPFILITLLVTEASGQFTTIMNVPPDDAPDSIGSESQLNLFDGGALPDFFDAGDLDGLGTNVEVNVFGGQVGRLFQAYSGSTVNISGGSVENAFNAFSGSMVNISGGSVGGSFDAYSGSTVTVSGGSVGVVFNASPGSTVNISGGSVGGFFIAQGLVSISGGSIGDAFQALAGSEIDLLGREFFLDGLPIEGLLSPGDSLVLDIREGRQLTGTLLDGNTFDFDLNASLTPPAGDRFDPNATLRLTLVPEPSVWALACLTCLTCLVLRRREPPERKTHLGKSPLNQGPRPGERRSENGPSTPGERIDRLGRLPTVVRTLSPARNYRKGTISTTCVGSCSYDQSTSDR